MKRLLAIHPLQVIVFLALAIGSISAQTSGSPAYANQGMDPNAVHREITPEESHTSTARESKPSIDAGTDSIPDAPSVGHGDHEPALPSGKSRSEAAVAPSGGPHFDAKVADSSYWMVTGATFGSVIAAAQLTHRCLEANACSSVPDPFHRRAVIYGVGLPVTAGVSYLDYYLKSKGKRWWFVPAAIMTAGDVIVASHAAKYRR